MNSRAIVGPLGTVSSGLAPANFAVRQGLTEHLVVLLAHQWILKVQLFETREPCQRRHVGHLRRNKARDGNPKGSPPTIDISLQTQVLPSGLKAKALLIPPNIRDADLADLAEEVV